MYTIYITGNRLKDQSSVIKRRLSFNTTADKVESDEDEIGFDHFTNIKKLNVKEHWKCRKEKRRRPSGQGCEQYRHTHRTLYTPCQIERLPSHEELGAEVEDCADEYSFPWDELDEI